MRIRLALVSAPVSLEERYGLFYEAANTEPSFGLICLASVAKQAGADVLVLSACSENLSVERTSDRVLDFKPDVVGITATTVGITAAAALARRLKQFNPQIVTIIGGCHVTALPVETLTTCPEFDAAVLGEGEHTLLEILENLDKSKSVPLNVPGTAVTVEGDVKVNEHRPLIDDLDSLPLPDWSLLPGFPEAFRPSPSRIKRWPCASVVLTRGCPNQCTFCDRSVFRNTCRAYTPDYAVRLLRDLADNYGVKEVLIEDDTFVISRTRVKEFCERLIEAKIGLTWSCLGRADRVDLELLKLMKKAGCWHISYGIESGDPDILDFVKKNLDIDQMRLACKWSREAGLRTKGFFMIGFPKETRASLESTRKLALSLPLDDISVMQLTPFPGSELYHVADKYGTFLRDWQKMNALETVFVPNGLSVEEMERARARLLRDFYRSPRVLYRQAQRIATNPRLAVMVLKGLPDFFRIVRKKK